MADVWRFFFKMARVNQFDVQFNDVDISYISTFKRVIIGGIDMDVVVSLICQIKVPNRLASGSMSVP